MHSKKTKSVKGSAVSKGVSAKSHSANRTSRGGGKGGASTERMGTKKGGYC